MSFTARTLVHAAMAAVSPVVVGDRVLTSQAALAWTMGVRPESVSRWGRGGISAARVFELAQIAGVVLTTAQVFQIADGKAVDVDSGGSA